VLSAGAEKEGESDGLFTRERILTSLLALITLICLYLCFRIILPFLTSLAFAATLAAATQRPYRWLARQVSNESLRAGIAVLLVAALIIIPAGLITTYAVQEGVATVEAINAGGMSKFQKRVESLPVIGEISRWTQKRFRLDDQLKAGAGFVASKATTILTSSFIVGAQLVLTLFLLFFFYRDGDSAYDTLRHLLPLSESESEAVLSRINSSMVATVNGSLTVAFVQSGMAGLMYVILGIHGAVLWALMTFFTALIPTFGTFMVWGPIAGYLFLTGSATKAVILVAFGMLAISTIDNVLYPYLVGDRMRLHTVPTFIAILGGIALFGPAGLILGPMVLAITTALLDVWWRRTTRGRSAEREISEINSGSPQVPPAEMLETKKTG